MQQQENQSLLGNNNINNYYNTDNNRNNNNGNALPSAPQLNQISSYNNTNNNNSNNNNQSSKFAFDDNSINDNNDDDEQQDEEDEDKGTEDEQEEEEALYNNNNNYTKNSNKSQRRQKGKQRNNENDDDNDDGGINRDSIAVSTVDDDDIFEEDDSLFTSYNKEDRIKFTDFPYKEFFNLISMLALYAAFASYQLDDEENSEDADNTFADLVQSTTYFLTVIALSYGPDILHALVMDRVIDKQLDSRISAERDLAITFGEKPNVEDGDSRFGKWALGTKGAAVICTFGAFAAFIVNHSVYGAIGVALASVFGSASVKWGQSAKEFEKHRTQAQMMGADALYKHFTTGKPGQFASKIKPYLDASKHSKISPDMAQILLDRVFGMDAKIYGYAHCLNHAIPNKEGNGTTTINAVTNSVDRSALLELFRVAGYTVELKEADLISKYAAEKARAAEKEAKKDKKMALTLCLLNNVVAPLHRVWGYLASTQVAAASALILQAYAKPDDYQALLASDDWKNYIAASVKFVSVDVAKFMVVLALGAHQLHEENQDRLDHDKKQLSGIYYAKTMRSEDYFNVTVGLSFAPIILHVAYTFFKNNEVDLDRTMARDIAGRLSSNEPLPIAANELAANARTLNIAQFGFFTIAFGTALTSGMRFVSDDAVVGTLLIGLTAYFAQLGNKSRQESTRLLYASEDVKLVIAEKLRLALEANDGSLTTILSPYVQGQGAYNAIRQDLAKFILLALFGGDAQRQKLKVLEGKAYNKQDVTTLKNVFALAKLGPPPEFTDEPAQPLILSSSSSNFVGNNNNNNANNANNVDKENENDENKDKGFCFGLFKSCS